MRIKAFISIGLVSLLSLLAIPVYAQGIPALPHAFYGTVTINNGSAPVGTTIEAIGTGVTRNIPQNPLTTTVADEYGSGGLYLLVQGDILDGATITFYVNGNDTGQTAEWHSGDTTELDLSVSYGGAGAGIAVAPTIEAELFGEEFTFSISEDGEILETIEATSEDGMLTLTIPDGTIALDEDGNPLESLEVAVDETPPDPPEDAYIIELAYDFGPDGATFDPPITLEYTYDPGTLPEGVAEADLVIAFYDAEAGEWVTCDCTCDPEANCITACVCHFTTFAIIGAVTPPEEEEVVPPEEEEVVPPEEEEVVLPPEEEVVPPEEVAPAKPLVNWPVLGGIIGGVIVVGLLVFFMVRRHRAA